MATCVETLLAGDFEDLFPATITPFFINVLTNKVFRVVSTAAQTVKFNFTFSPVSSISSFSITVTVFRASGSTFINEGGVTFSDLVGSFTKEFASGDYFLCIRSTPGFNGTILGEFRPFPAESRITPLAFEGATMLVDLGSVKPPAPCDEPIYFDIVDGELPPGLDMTDFGRVFGKLPNLDCLPDAIDYAPSQNWYSMDDSGVSMPWGRVWRFHVRARILDQEEAEDQRWFCIRVHNNWSFDRDNFMKHFPFKSVREVQVIDQPAKLPGVVSCEPCPEPVETIFVPKPLGATVCEPCESPHAVTDIQLIAIPHQIADVPVIRMIEWWEKHKDSVSDCPEVQKFIDNLKNSSHFQALLRQNGYGIEAPDPRVFVEAQAYERFIQLTSVQLKDGRNDSDLDAMMIRWKNKQNQRLPVSGTAYLGTTMEVSLA